MFLYMNILVLILTEKLGTCGAIHQKILADKKPKLGMSFFKHSISITIL